MNIVIRSIPHKAHRYSTCGDWFFEADGTLIILVSDELPEKSKQLVALHELAEVFMCQANHISQKEVDDFDMNFEANRKPDDQSEPGDHKEAPYHVAHRLATAMETVAAAAMGVPWLDHEASVNKLFE